MTTKPSRKFKTPAGTFTFAHLSLPYYSFGIQRVKLTEEQYALVASPEKALFDKIINTSGLIFRSMVNVMPYLVENLRIDEDALKELDISAMSSWLTDAPKKESLQMLIKALEKSKI